MHFNKLEEWRRTTLADNGLFIMADDFAKYCIPKIVQRYGIMQKVNGRACYHDRERLSNFSAEKREVDFYFWYGYSPEGYPDWEHYVRIPIRLGLKQVKSKFEVNELLSPRRNMWGGVGFSPPAPAPNHDTGPTNIDWQAEHDAWRMTWGEAERQKYEEMTRSIVAFYGMFGNTTT